MLRALLYKSKWNIPGAVVGGWSVGAPLYMILILLIDRHDELKIIEFGSGQSSLFFKQVSELHTSKIKRHVVVEHDRQFAQRSIDFGIDVKIAPVTQWEGGSRYDLPLEMLGEATEVFNVFVIDGPFGSRRLSRNNIFEFIESNQLPRDFVIIVDDTERAGERETEMMIMRLLRESGHNPIRRRYQGEKMCTVIACKGGEFSHLCSYAAFL